MTFIFLKGKVRNKKSKKSEESQTDVAMSRKVCCFGYRMPSLQEGVFWKSSPGAEGRLVPKVPNTYR